MHDFLHLIKSDPFARFWVNPIEFDVRNLRRQCTSARNVDEYPLKHTGLLVDFHFDYVYLILFSNQIHQPV